MEFVIIENVELVKSIDEVNNLLDSDDLKSYKIIPKNIVFNFGEPEVWFGAITAIYTVIQIIQFGSSAVKEMSKNRELNYEKNQERYQITNIKEHDNSYTITIEDREVQINVTKNKNSYSIKVENMDKFLS